MCGYLNKHVQVFNAEKSGDVVSNVIGQLGSGLNFGAQLVRVAVAKAVPLGALEKEYFALKNGVLYWF